MKRSATAIAKHLRGSRDLDRDPLGIVEQREAPARDRAVSESKPARLREDWYDRTYRQLRGFLDQMFR